MVTPWGVRDRGEVLLVPDHEAEKALAELAKVLGDPTRRTIYFFVRGAEDSVRAGDIAQSFYLHRNVARSHLDRLVKAGLLKSELRRGGSGRPAKAYSPTDRGLEISVPSRRFRMLADLAIDVLAAGESIEGMRDRAMEIGRRWQGDGTVAADCARPLPEAATMVASKLSQRGAEATAYDLADCVELEVKNCIFRESAQRHPEVVCQAHQAMLAGMFEAAGVDADLEVCETVPEGASVCRFNVVAAVPTDS